MKKWCKVKKGNITNEEGRYAVTLDSNDDLVFSSQLTTEHREPLKGRLRVDVELMPEANELQEVEGIGEKTAKNIREVIDSKYLFFQKEIKEKRLL